MKSTACAAWSTCRLIGIWRTGQSGRGITASRLDTGIDRRASPAPGSTSAEDMEAECDAWAAEIADAVIDTLPIQSRNAIEAVYACGRGWTLRHDLLDAALVEAGDLFWQRAKRRGLL
jgi:hypothetical protein